LKFSHCPVKRGLFWSPNFFFIGILVFLLLRSPCKIQIPTICPYWGLATAGRRRKEEDKLGQSCAKLRLS
jgi:hypothetical protein